MDLENIPEICAGRTADRRIFNAIGFRYFLLAGHRKAWLKLFFLPAEIDVSRIFGDLAILLVCVCACVFQPFALDSFN